MDFVDENDMLKEARRISASIGNMPPDEQARAGVRLAKVFANLDDSMGVGAAPVQWRMTGVHL